MMDRQMLAYVLLVLISQSYTISHLLVGQSEKGDCHDNEYRNENGICCDKCHPGFKLKKQCSTPNSRSVCVKCENGTFLENPNNNDNCFRCRKCNKAHFKEISPCTHKSDRVCGCETGYYYRKLDDTSGECASCRICGPGQLVVAPCAEKENTKCGCKEHHYAVGLSLCNPCVECRKDCEHLCNSSTTLNPSMSIKPTSRPDIVPQIVVPLCAFITVLALGVFMIYEGIRFWKKRRHALLSQKSSPASNDQTFIITVAADTVHNESTPLTDQQCETEQSGKLPDCVPREIKVSGDQTCLPLCPVEQRNSELLEVYEFFYFVLDEVPIGRFKELVRRLGVSEQNIDRAEQDHRNSKDAHYQMLKFWSDSGSGGGSNVLPCHCIQTFVDTLKDMCLVSCADNIENRFLSQDTNSSR